MPFYYLLVLAYLAGKAEGVRHAEEKIRLALEPDVFRLKR